MKRKIQYSLDDSRTRIFRQANVNQISLKIALICVDVKYVPIYLLTIAHIASQSLAILEWLTHDRIHELLDVNELIVLSRMHHFDAVRRVLPSEVVIQTELDLLIVVHDVVVDWCHSHVLLYNFDQIVLLDLDTCVASDKGHQ